jgi:hypothetical protein
MIYEIVDGPPALPYPEPEPEPTPPVKRRLPIVLAMLGAIVAIVASLAALWWMTSRSIDSAAPTVSASETPTAVPVDPPPVKWVVPDVPDAGNVSVDARFIATLARHGVGPGATGSRQAMIDGAHQICGLLAAGWTQQQVIDQLAESQSATITELQFKMVVVTAVDLYCRN